MKSFAQLKENLGCDFKKLKSIRIAVLGDTSTQFLVQALRGTGFDRGFDLQIFESDFNQIERQIFDSGSELYRHNPEIVVIFQSTHKLLDKYNTLKPEESNQIAETRLGLINSLYTSIIEKTKAKIIYFNFPEINDYIFGNYANTTESSFIFQLRKLNYELMIFSSKHSNLYLCDLSSIQNQIGKAALFPSSLYVDTEMVLSIDALPSVSAYTLDIISALYGKFKKCLILDLDNTLWGGIIGDDGLEKIQIGNLGIGKAFTEFQYWIKKLKNRGIILAICSKNKESIAKGPFENHPDMILRLDDIAVFKANWDNKVDNIRHIQTILNIGFDSIVFIDDSPFERNIVRENIPDITVPELPEDPSDYLEYLYTLNLFETVSFSSEDTERTKQYQIENQRSELKNSFGNEDEFLKSLNMLSIVEPFNTYNTPRISQLSQRSNQFNMRTVRYTEADIKSISNSADFHNFAFTLEDKFGDYGLICVVILKKLDVLNLFIDTWFMSCRVLKRGMENFVLNTIANHAKERGFTFLVGEYIPSSKNEIVKNHYQDMGFEQKDLLWSLNITNFENRNCFISLKDVVGIDNQIKPKDISIDPGKIKTQYLPRTDVKDPEEVSVDKGDMKNLSQTEVILFDIWSEVLKTRNFSISDNFFEIGGDSLIAILVFAKIESAFNVKIHLRVFFDSPRIIDLAEIVDALIQKETEHKSIRKTEVGHKIIKGEL